MIYGIDLGTTNSLIAMFTENGPEIIQNKYGDNLTPSIVSFTKSGEYVVGKSAKERLIKFPEKTFYSYKRYMGTSKKYFYDNKSYSPTELSAMTLKSICEDATIAVGQPINSAIISVPAYFTDNQRRSTIAAAKLIGLSVEALINEPTAAALAYHLHESKNENIVMVVDLGGGTFDVSILDIFESVVEVKAIAGDNYLGGIDFDHAIAKYILETNNIDKNTLSASDIEKVNYIAEEIKILFNKNDSVSKTIHFSSKSIDVVITKSPF